MAQIEFSALETEFNQIQRELDGDAAGVAAAGDYLASTHALHRAEPLPWAFTPQILNDGQLNVIRGAASTMSSIMAKVYKLYVSDSAFRAKFGFSDEVSAFTALPTGYECAVPLCRIDIDLTRGGSYQIRSIDVDGFTGMTSTVEVTRAVMKSETYRRFADKHADIEALDPMDSLIETLRAVYESWANAEAGTRHPKTPAVGIVGYPESADLDEVSDLVERLAEQGVFARFVDVCNLRVETAAGISRLVDDDGPIACVCRIAKTEDIAARPCPGTEALAEAARRGLTCVVNGFATLACVSEKMFPLLGEPEVVAALTDEENEFVAAHIPAADAAAPAGEPLGMFVFGGELAGVFPVGAEKDIMGESSAHVYRGCLAVHE